MAANLEQTNRLRGRTTALCGLPWNAGVKICSETHTLTCSGFRTYLRASLPAKDTRSRQLTTGQTVKWSNSLLLGLAVSGGAMHFSGVKRELQVRKHWRYIHVCVCDSWSSKQLEWTLLAPLIAGACQLSI